MENKIEDKNWFAEFPAEVKKIEMEKKIKIDTDNISIDLYNKVSKYEGKTMADVYDDIETGFLALGLCDTIHESSRVKTAGVQLFSAISHWREVEKNGN